MNGQENNNMTIEAKHIEALQLILEEEQGMTVTYDEALEIGRSLINFFELLVEDADNNMPVTDEAEKVEAIPQVQQQPQQLLLIQYQ